MKRQTRIDDAVLREMVESRSTRSLSKRILEGPRTAWKTESGGKTALSYSVQFGVEKGEEAFVKSMVQDHHVFDFKASLAGELSVLHTSSCTRIECRGRSLLGSNYTVIKDKQQGSLFLDHGTRTYLQMSQDSAVNHKFKERVQASTELVKGKGGELKVVVQIRRPYNIRYEIYIDPDKRYQPFAREVLCSVIGCPDEFIEAGIDLSPVLREGIPVRGKVFMAGANGEYRLISSFAVRNLKLTKADGEAFAAPRDYRDLRTTGNRTSQGKARPIGPTLRLSDIRPELKRPSFDRNVPVFDPTTGSDRMTDVGASREALTFRTDNFEFPTCFDETYGSLIANVADEKLLDDIRFIVNGITRRLTGFNGTGGNISIDWLNQMKAASDALGTGDPGGGLYVLLHDEDAMGVSHTRKTGLLDRLAVSDLGTLLMNGDNLASLGLAAPLQARVNAVLADATITPANRFASFTLEEQGQLIDAYVFAGVGTIKLTYPTSTGTQRIFHDLLDVRLDNIEFDIRINNTAIINTFAFDANSVHLVINLPDASGKAFMSRWPTEVYGAAVLGSLLACIFFPPACTLSAILIAVGLFIGLDFAFVSLDLSNLMIDAHIRLVPNGVNVLQPDVQLTLDADVSASYTSVIPDGIHQILSLIYNVILNHTDIVITFLQGQLQDKLNSFLKDDLGITYPPAFGPVPLTGISNSVEFVADDRGYVEQALNAGTLGVICPYITQVDGEIKSKILLLRDQFKAGFTDPVAAFAAAGGLLGWTSVDFTNVARYYLGTVLSQNFINHYVYTLWRTNKFNYEFTVDECRQLYLLLSQVFPAFRGLRFEDTRMMAHLWPAVPPRTVFTPKPASEGDYYSTTFFDDVRLCLEFRSRRKKIFQKMEFLFAAQTYTEIGFGGFNSSVGKLDLLKTSDRVFDIYFDLRTLDARIIHPEVQSFIVPGMAVRVDLDYSALGAAQLQSMFRLACHFALATRDREFIPRGAGDPIYIQRYDLGNNAVQAVFQLVPFQGNLYVSQGLSGAATAIYEGALNIDTLDKLTALIIRAVI